MDISLSIHSEPMPSEPMPSEQNRNATAYDIDFAVKTCEFCSFFKNYLETHRSQTRATEETTNKNNSAQTVYPLVPNLWLMARKNESNQGGDKDKRRQQQKGK